MVYVNKLQYVLDYITIQHPEGWEQGVWAKRVRPEHIARLSPTQKALLTRDPNTCGSTACLAGTAVALEFGKNSVHWTRFMEGVDDACVLADVAPRDFQGVTISEAARIILDLTYNQGERLFDGDNSLWTLWDLAAEFTDGEIVRPDDEQIEDAIYRMREGRRARDLLISMIDEMEHANA